MKGIVRKIKETVAQVETLGGDLLNAVRFLQNYGFASHPEEGAEAVLTGAPDNALIVCVEDRRYRIPLKPGEVALYHKDGDRVVLRDGNVLELTTKNLRIRTESCSLVNDQGDLLHHLSQALELLATSQVQTLLGPQPLLPASVDVRLLKQKIDSFLGGSHASG